MIDRCNRYIDSIELGITFDLKQNNDYNDKR